MSQNGIYPEKEVWILGNICSMKGRKGRPKLKMRWFYKHLAKDMKKCLSEKDRYSLLRDY